MNAASYRDTLERISGRTMTARQLGIGGGVLAGGLALSFVLPGLFKRARRSMPAIGGMTYRSGVSGGRPSADPARGRPA